MKRFLLKLLLASSILLTGAEVTVRWAVPALVGDGIAQLEDYYREEEEIAAAGPITHLAVGTSQVGAAVDPDTLQALLRAAAPPEERARIRAVNAAKGYSTPMQHYFGLRRLFERYPASVEGVVVFLEAPEGVAEYRTWDSDWTLTQWPSLLGPLIPTSELPRFYLQSDNTIADKMRVTTAHFLHSSRYPRHIRIKLEATVNRWLAPPRSDEPAADLTTRAGIRTDRAGVELAKEEAKREAEERRVAVIGERGSQPSDWDATVQADIARLVRAHGGEVVFFAMPQSPVMMEGMRARVMLERKRAFETWARNNGIPVLYPRPFEYGAEDFPDDLHLRNSRSGEFTARLAEAYLRWEQSRRSSRTDTTGSADTR